MQWWLRPAYLSKRLTPPIPTKDGGTLRTILEACEYMAAIGKGRELRAHWQQVRELMLQEADVVAVSWQVRLAVLKHAKLDALRMHWGILPGATKIEVVRVKPIDPARRRLRKHRWAWKTPPTDETFDARFGHRSMVKTTGLIGRQAGQANSPPACGPAGYLNGVRPGSELGRQVAVDFESDADFHECGSCPVHSCLQFHNNQQPKLGDVWWQEGGGAAF